MTDLIAKVRTFPAQDPLEEESQNGRSFIEARDKDYDLRPAKDWNAEEGVKGWGFDGRAQWGHLNSHDQTDQIARGNQIEPTDYKGDFKKKKEEKKNKKPRWRPFIVAEPHSWKNTPNR